MNTPNIEAVSILSVVLSMEARIGALQKDPFFSEPKKTVSAFQVSSFFGRRWQQKSSVLKFVLGGGGVFSRRKPPATGVSIVFFDGG